MGLAGRLEALFCTEVDPNDIGFEPAATPGSELRRLGHLRDAEHPLIEGNRLSLATRRHRQLDAVQPHDAHRSPHSPDGFLQMA